MKILKFLPLSLILLSERVFAAESTSIPCPLSPELCDAQSAINKLTGLILPAAALVLLIMLIYAGFTKLTAAGDADKEKQAMKIIQASIIGFAIIALSAVIVGTIGSLFGVKTT